MEQMPADITPTSAASADAAEASLKQGQLHPNTISVERKTFARWGPVNGCASCFCC